MATGGSTNAALHLTAVAAELGIGAAQMMDAYDRLSASTPQVARVNPSSKYDMEDLHKAGRIPRVMQAIEALLHRDCPTVSARTVVENLDGYRYKFPPNPEVIGGIDRPFGEQKGRLCAYWRRSNDSHAACHIRTGTLGLTHLATDRFTAAPSRANPASAALPNDAGQGSGAPTAWAGAPVCHYAKAQRSIQRSPSTSQCDDRLSPVTMPGPVAKT